MTTITLTNIHAATKGMRVGPVTLTLEAGVHAFLGEPTDGIGLLLRVLAGEAKSRGSIQGIPSESVASVFADLPLPEELSCAEYLGLANGFRGLSRSEDEVLARFGLTDWARQRISKLAKPERKALAIAEALTSHCALLLLEEPLASVSPAAVSAIENALVEKTPSRLCVYSTNQPETAARFADSVAVFERGCAVIHAKPNDPRLSEGRYRVDCSDPGKLLSLLRRDSGGALKLETMGDTVWVEARLGAPAASIDVAKLITRAAAEGSINVRRLGCEAAMPEVIRARLGHQLQALRAASEAPR